MTLQNIFNSITERLQTTATVKAVYGEPVVAEGKTIIPVARVRFGFGAGYGAGFGESEMGREGVPDHVAYSKNGEGGGGGAVDIRPIGFIEITAGETRFVSIEGRGRTARLAFLGLVAGFFLFRRRRKGDRTH